MAEQPTATALARRCAQCGKLYPYDVRHVCTSPATDDTMKAEAAVATAETFAGAPPVVSAETIPEPLLAGGTEDLVGVILGERYEIQERLSQGGMGVVFRARHVVLENTLAVKFLLRPQDEDAQRRFLLEAKLASKINHLNTVVISDFGVLADGRSYLVMEYLRGPTLSTILDSTGRMEPLRACKIALQIARGLRAVHEQGIVHRDLKPDNIFLLEQGGQRDLVKIVDFGIALAATRSESSAAMHGEAAAARAADVDALGATGAFTTDAATGGSEGPKTAARDGARNTLPGTLLGTPHYMSPEQARAGDVDTRADQYALGCILYEMLVGDVPFHGSRLSELLEKHISEVPIPPRQRQPGLAISDGLEALVLRLLAKSPDARFAAMGEVEEALEREIARLQAPPPAVAPAPSRSLRRWLAASLMGVLLLVGIGIARLAQHREPASQNQLSAAELGELRRLALDTLRTDLADPVAKVRLGALQRLGPTREASMRSAIEAVLKDSDVEVQAQAALALGLIGDRAATAALRALRTKDSPTNVNAAAAGALDLLGDSSGTAALSTALDGPSEELKKRAAYLLCDRGVPRAVTTLTAIAERLPAEQAIPLWGRLAQCGVLKARDQLRGQLQGPAELLLPAAGALAHLGDAQGRDRLLALAQKPGPDQLPAARLLASAEEGAVGAAYSLHLIRRVLGDDQAAPAAQLLALEGIGIGGERGDIRRVGELLRRRSGDARLRQAAAGAVLQIASREPSAMSEQGLAWARSALLDSDWVARQAAAELLGAADSGSAEATALLSKLARDGDARVRQSAVRALGRRRDRAALEALRGNLNDTDPAVRKETLLSLGNVAELLFHGGARTLVGELAGWLGDTLRSGTPEEQLLGSALLLRLGDDSQRQRFTEFLVSADELLRKLAVQRAPAEASLLGRMLKDEVYGVRFAAALRLADIDKFAAEPQQKESLKSVLKEGLAKGGADAVAAYGLLQRLGEPGPKLAEVEAQLHSGDARARMDAVQACSRLPTELAVQVLSSAARDPEPLVRRLVVEVTAELPTRTGQMPAGGALLRRLTGDGDIQVRSRAQILLSRILPAELTLPVASAPSPSRVETPRPVSPVVVDAGGLDAAKAPSPDLAPAVAPPPLVPEAVPVKEPAEEAAGDDADPVAQMFEKARKALDKKDTEKARKQLDKATALCVKSRSTSPACAKLAFEGSTTLSGLYEKGGQWGEAMQEYERILSRAAALKLTAEQSAQLTQAMERLKPSVGQIIELKKVGKKCKEVKTWVRTGTHQINVNDEVETVTVGPGEVVKVGACK